ncbi:hypothetical protein GCM10007989_23600 [Devosia pacifica]|uniref:Transporter n=1 Tax=Devosia pacifica TaxID=1335967 RepID=A0A918VV40_9HYPH|nr:hypothetical protein [Devosia pacifica]GHA27053.1 hypothetical protein GCM10007989_23600 [Devosia pacifica]
MHQREQKSAPDTAEVECREQGTPVQHRPQWSSERAFVLSTAAVGVGLGNLWRFPYVLGDNGGGAFLLAYLLVMVAIAVPLASLEIASGRIGHGSTVAVFRRLKRPAASFGWAVVLLTLVINAYYFVVSG